MDSTRLKNPSRWVNPEFAKYGFDAAFGMTDFLYSDPIFQGIIGNDNWDTCGVQVVSVERSLHFDGVASAGIVAGLSQVLPMNFSNGQNFILASRAAVATGTVSGTVVQLDQSQILYTEAQQGSGLNTCDPAPLFNVVGSGEWAKIFPTPRKMNGKIVSNVTITNSFASQLIDDVYITWDVIMLYTGR